MDRNDTLAGSSSYVKAKEDAPESVLETMINSIDNILEDVVNLMNRIEALNERLYGSFGPPVEENIKKSEPHGTVEVLTSKVERLQNQVSEIHGMMHKLESL